MARRVDANQAQIVQQLRDFGATVLDLHAVGKGCVDILCGYKGKSYPMEIKTLHGKLTDPEKKFYDEWRGNYYIVHDIVEAIQILIDGSED